MRARTMLAAAVLMGALFAVETVWAASQGPMSPSSCVNNTSIGNRVWLNPANAQAAGGAQATNSLRRAGSGSNVGNYLRCSGFGFTIPAGATIDGILMEAVVGVNKSGGVRDNDVRLVKGGVIQGSGATGRRNNATVWTTTLTALGHGSASDLWDNTWTDANINAANFGAVLSAIDTGTANRTGLADHVRMTVFFTAAPTPTPTSTPTNTPTTTPTLVPTNTPTTTPTLVPTTTPTATPTDVATATPTGTPPTPTPSETPTPSPTSNPTVTPTPCSNDDVNCPTNIPGVQFSSSQSTTLATKAVDDPVSCGSGANSHSVWYRLTAASSVSLRMGTAGSSYDTVLAVFKGSPGAFTKVACNDNLKTSLQSRVKFSAVAGTTYTIEVMSFGTKAGGTLNLTVDPICGGQIATRVGTEGDDLLDGSAAKDVIVGLGGKDTVRGFGGADRLCGNDGDDLVLGGDGNDKLYGGNGADTLQGEAGDDLLDGGAGTDSCQGGTGTNTLKSCP